MKLRIRLDESCWFAFFRGAWPGAGNNAAGSRPGPCPGPGTSTWQLLGLGAVVTGAVGAAAALRRAPRPGLGR